MNSWNLKIHLLEKENHHPSTSILGVRNVSFRALYWSHYLDRVGGKPTGWWFVTPYLLGQMMENGSNLKKHQVVFDRKKSPHLLFLFFYFFFSPEMFSYHSP